MFLEQQKKRKTVILNYNNISQYLYLSCIFDQIYAALVSMNAYQHTHMQIFIYFNVFFIELMFFLCWCVSY